MAETAVAAAAGGATKAAAKGGGNAAAAKVARGGGKSEATAAVGAGGGQAPKKKTSPSKEPAKKGGTQKGSRGRRLGRWAWSDNRKLLTAEFVLCIAVLGIGTLVSPEDSKHDAERAMIKGSALAGVFFLLALVSSGGGRAARAANALGTLITASYVLTSADVHNIVEWTASFFSPASAKEVPGGAEASSALADQDQDQGEVQEA